MRKDRAVLRNLVPSRLRAFLRAELRRLLQAEVPGLVEGRLAPLRQELNHLPTRYPCFAPHRPGELSYVLPRQPPPAERHPLSPLPVPPAELRFPYGDSAEEYLELGREHVQAMREIVERAGPLAPGDRVLDFGCSAGRLLRWLLDWTEGREVWGADVSSTHVLWAQQHLSPPFHLVTTTTAPHLPFADGYFGLVYAGSVFTHVDDLARTWFLELRRVLRPGGRLYVTIHDRETMRLLPVKYPGRWLTGWLRGCREYQDYRRSDFGMFTLGRSVYSQVFYDVDWLCRGLEPYYRTLSVTPEAFGYQTAVLFERK